MGRVRFFLFPFLLVRVPASSRVFRATHLAAREMRRRAPGKFWPFRSVVVSCSIVLLWAAFGSVGAGASDGDGDKHALLELKSAVIVDPLGFLSNWNPDDGDACAWNGVACDTLSRRVTALRISSNFSSACSEFDAVDARGNFSLLFPCSDYVGGKQSLPFSAKLRGSLSPAIGRLSQLKVLSLGFNGFSGELPQEIGQLRFLEVLDLSFNDFGGPIPSGLQNCTALRVVDLSGNQLNGTVPSFLATLRSLEVVSLSFNMLTGPIPSELGEKCGVLEHLNLAGNFLSSSIPSSLGNCSRLRSLILSSNMLEDRIPSALGNLGMLEVLDVSRNYLSGIIPPELGNCSQLKILVFKNTYGPLFTRKVLGTEDPQEENSHDDFNFFEGQLPESIAKLPNLRVLWAPNSNLGGSFPHEWGSCSDLEILNVAQNFFVGQIPATLGSCQSLYFLDLSSNNFTGSLPKEIPVPCMVVFNASRNFLSGNIPSFTRDCPQKSANSRVPRVNMVDFYTYFFYQYSGTGVFSFSFNADDLAILHDFSRNMFSGPIPSSLIASDRLSARPFYGLWLNENNLEGNISSYSFLFCRYLAGLAFDIGNNKITGELPIDMGNMCSCMKLLNMAGNELMGPFPPTFANLVALVNLNLSRNKIQGSIPSYIGQMMNMRCLSLSTNNFTGTIPPELAQLASLEVLELSSNALSGEIPAAFAKLQHLDVLNLDHNRLSGQIPAGFSNITSLSVFNVSFNNLSGPVPLNPESIKCENVQGNKYLQPCTTISSSSEWEQQHSGNVSQQAADSPPRSSLGGGNGFKPIEIASITSASVIVCVLISLVGLLLCMKRLGCKSVLCQGSERKEVVTFNNIGVELTYENVVRATGGFNIQNCIGSGGFGATYKAEIVPGVVVAVKRLSLGRFQGVQQFSAEIRTLGRVQHPNLVTLIGYHVSESEMFLIYNYLPGGNLEKFIQDRPRRTVQWSVLHKIALDIARALAYLHNECVPRVLHRDIKPSNILLDNNFNAYLSDFGLARLLGTSETHATTDVAGTFGYVAPEYAMTCRVSDKADVYSYGVVLLELISDKKALDPSFSSFGNGFNIVQWASMLLRQGQADEFFTAGLWDSGPHDDLVEMLHLAVLCTGEHLSARPSMKQVAQSLKRIQPSTG